MVQIYFTEQSEIYLKGVNVLSSLSILYFSLLQSTWGSVNLVLGVITS